MECDRMAYQHVNPNFNYGGVWFSKLRYGICYHQGKKYPWHVAEQRMIDKLQEETGSYDPVDWPSLMADYLYWRMRFSKQGYRIRHQLISAGGPYQEA